MTGALSGEPRCCLRKREPGVSLILALVKRESSMLFGARCVGDPVLLEDPSMGILADSGRGCRTRDAGLLQLVQREGLDLEGVSIVV